MNVGGNKTAYIGYRAVYRVERGTREVYRTASGVIHDSNSYTAKLVTHGQYALIYKMIIVPLHIKLLISFD